MRKQGNEKHQKTKRSKEGKKIKTKKKHFSFIEKTGKKESPKKKKKNKNKEQNDCKLKESLPLVPALSRMAPILLMKRSIDISMDT